jgi:hypothetical protein
MSFLPAGAVDWISIGAKVGAPIATPTQVPGFLGSDESKWILMGPSVEFKLPRGFALEVDALYQRTGYSEQFSSTLLETSNLVTTSRKACVDRFGTESGQPRAVEHKLSQRH